MHSLGWLLSAFFWFATVSSGLGGDDRPAGSAGAGTNTAVHLDEMVVTATKSPLPRIEAPASVTVIDAAAIRNSAAGNINDVLRHVEGISVLSSVGIGYGIPSQINPRGIPGQYAVLLLVDGMPLNESASAFVSVNEVPCALMKQVEVVRGPFSALYGTDAFGGVINVRTFDPGELPAVAVSAGVGNEDYWTSSAQASVGDRRAGAWVSFDTRGIGNWLAHGHLKERQWNPATQSYVEITREADNYDYRDQRVNGKFTADVGGNVHLDVLARYLNSELGYGTKDIRPAYPQPEDQVMDNESAMLGSVLSFGAPDGAGGELRAYGRWQQREVLGLDFSHMQGMSPVFARSRSDLDASDWKVDGLARLDPMGGHKVTAGADFLESFADFSALKDNATGTTLPTSTGERARVDNTGIYVQDEFPVVGSLKAVGGLRVDSHSEFGEAWSPKLGLILATGDGTRWRASVGRAYRAPSLVELFQPTIMLGSVTYESNPDLKPEYIVSVDAGVEQDFGHGLKAQLGVFRNDMDDLITTQVAGTRLVPMNTERSWSSGVEAGVDWQVVSWAAIFANGTWEESEDEQTGYDLGHIPDALFNAGARLSERWGPWRAEASVLENYVGDRGNVDLQTGTWEAFDAYWRTDASVKAGFKDAFWVRIGVQNALNTRYQEWELINPAPGRLYAVEVGGSF